MNNADKNGICFVTFSNNCDHQEACFSISDALRPFIRTFNVGINNPKYKSKFDDASFYFDCPKRPGICKGSFKFSIIRKIAKKILDLKVEFVFFESSHLWNLFLINQLRNRVKIVQVIHDVIPHSDSRGMKTCNKFLCKRADYIVLKSKKYYGELKRIYGVNQEKVYFLPITRDYPKKQFQPTNDGKPVFLFFGRIRKYKGIDVVLKMATDLPNVNFMVVGSPDSETSNTVLQLKQLSNVQVVDREVTDQEANYYFRLASYVILPYESATQSGVVADSYKNSRPVIAFNVGALSEQVKDGVSGFLIENGNVSDFEKKILSLSSQNFNRAKMSSDAFAFGFSQYSCYAAVDSFISFFTSISNIDNRSIISNDCK